jgi:CDP-glucose 4,6-dehydratase
MTDTWTDAVTHVQGSVQDQVAVSQMLESHGVRTVFHVAAQAIVGRAIDIPVVTFEANIAGTWSTLEACRQSSTVEQVVNASSDKAYGSNPVLPYDEDMPLLAINPYDVSKACADLIARSYHHTFGLPVCVTRCGNFFGPGDRNTNRIVPGTISSLLRGERPVIRSDGMMVRDYLYVVDGALAYLQLAERMAADPSVHGEVFNFSTERPLSVLELVAMLQEAVGTDLEPVIQGIASYEIPEQYLSSRKARELLGWRPRHSMEAAIAETVAWYRSRVEEQV